MTYLKDLPNELLLIAGGHLRDHDLNSLLRVSRHFTDLFTPILYKRCLADRGLAALSWAAEEGKACPIKVLLDRYNVPVDLQDPNTKMTLLHTASFNGKAEVVSLLLQRGAAVDAKTSPFEPGEDDMHVSEGVEVEGISPLCVFFGGFATYFSATPLHLAAYQGSLETVHLLLAGGADVNAEVDVADGDLEPSECPKAIHIAASRGHTAVVEALLDIGVDVNVECDSYYRDPPLIRGIFSGKTEVVKLLLNRGANINWQNPNNHEEYQTPLCAAAATRLEPDDNGAMVQLLLDNGASMHPDAENICWPLVHATQVGHLSALRILLKAGAPIKTNTDDINNGTLLHVAVSFVEPSAVGFLIEAGINTGAVDSNGDTAFYRSISNFVMLDYPNKERLACVFEIMKRAQDADGMNYTESRAREKGREDIVQLMESWHGLAREKRETGKTPESEGERGIEDARQRLMPKLDWRRSSRT